MLSMPPESKTYQFIKELGLPSILGDSGWNGAAAIEQKIYELERTGFGDGVSGRIKFKGHHAYYEGRAFLLDLRIVAEYDSEEDKKAIIEKIDEATRTPHSRMLWFT